MLCIPCIFNECGTYFVTVLQECTSTFILLFQAYFYKFGFLDYLEIREKKTSFPHHLIIFCFRSFVSYLGEEWKEKFSQWKNFLKILCSNIIGLTKNAVSAKLTMKPTQKNPNKCMALNSLRIKSFVFQCKTYKVTKSCSNSLFSETSNACASVRRRSSQNKAAC